MARRQEVNSPLPDKIGGLLQESRWLVLGAVALILSLALWGYHPDDPGWSHATGSAQLHNPAGRLGAWGGDLLLAVFGLSAWLWVVLLLMFVWWGYHRLNSGEPIARRPLLISLAGFFLLLVASSAMEALRFYSLQVALPLAPGGMLGAEVGRLASLYLGYTGATLALLLAMVVVWSIFTGMSWLLAFERLGWALETFVMFFYGMVDRARDRRLGRELAQIRESEVEVEKRRVEHHEPIIIETPAPEPAVSAKAEKRLEREKQGALFPEAII
ncbi:MAG TPA: DNA translocase FtsK 4TM domain-containing protein, partial [Rhodocyclaceae bacterium]|nr:DNA translocase FtsK 4TM domain-containing protein [Rhodocyclaceae bacterium]